MNEYLKGLYIEPPIELEKTILSSKMLDEEQKRLIIDLAWALYWFKELKIVHNKRNPMLYEVWIVPWEGPKVKINFILSFKRIILSSGSLRNEDLTKLRLWDAEIKEYSLKSTITHEHCLVLVSENYNCAKLASRLAKLNYIVYVTHSSYDEAMKFTKKLGYMDSVIPETIKELDNALTKGVKVINLIQCSKLALNLRLPGDVAIVNTFITKHVEYYHDPKLLKTRVVLSETYQALGRILNAEKRPVVLVVPTEVYEILKEKFAQMKCTIKKVKHEDEIIAEVVKWIPNPLGLKYGHKEKKPYETIVTAKLRKKKAKGREYEYAIIEVPLPKEYAGKKFRITQVF